MLRNVLAVIIGIITGIAVYMGFFVLLVGIPGIAGKSYLTQAIFLLMALGGIVVVPLASSFCGCWVAARRGSAHPMLLAMIVGSALAGVSLLVMYFQFGGDGDGLEGSRVGVDGFPVLLHLAAAWLAGFIEQKRRAAVDTPTPAFAETPKAE